MSKISNAEHLDRLSYRGLAHAAFHAMEADARERLFMTYHSRTGLQWARNVVLRAQDNCPHHIEWEELLGQLMADVQVLILTEA